MMMLFPLIFLPIINPSTFEKCNDSDIGKLQRQTFHEIHPSAIKQSMKISLLIPRLFI